MQPRKATARPRRAVLLGAALPLAAPAARARPTAAAGAGAGRFPDRPIRLIVPWTAGGSADGQLRSLADLAGRRLGQPVVVENRPGATGSLGAVALKEARPDGYLLSQVHMSVLRVPLMQPRPAYDPLADFTYILQLTGSVLGVVVRAEAPWRTLPELIAHARANPGRVTYGTLGIGSGQHLAMEKIARIAGVEWTHVPYRGTADTLTALMGGHIEVAADSSAWAPMVEEGRFRLLATFGSRRTRRFPEVPTLREQGIDYAADSPYGLCGPRGMDPEVARTLHDAFREALFDPAHRPALDRFDQPILYLDGAAWAAAARRYVAEERELLRQIGLLAQQ
jgi:tripartite-type tricarboxylate transporter receptor subunit TctC